MYTTNLVSSNFLLDSLKGTVTVKIKPLEKMLVFLLVSCLYVNRDSIIVHMLCCCICGDKVVSASCFPLVQHERMKFLCIGTQTGVEVYAWAQKPYSKFMAFKVGLVV